MHLCLGEGSELHVCGIFGYSDPICSEHVSVSSNSKLKHSGFSVLGKGDVKTLDEIFCMALRLCGLVSVAFFAACVFGGKYLMLIFTNESVLVEYGVNYLRIAGFSYLLTGISQCYLIIMKVSGHAKTTAAVSSATVCINIVLNAIFIYGTFGIPSRGVQGAALATLLARIIELTCSVIISYRKGYIHPQMKFLFYRNKELSKDFSKCGMPILGASLFWGIGFTSYSTFMGHLGADAAAGKLCGSCGERYGLLFQRGYFRCSRDHGRK